MFIITPIDRTRGVSAAQGFRAATTHCGLRNRSQDDLSLIVADEGAAIALVATSNQVKAAPVQVNAAHMATNGGAAKAVLINTANANACTGEPGLATAKACAQTLADALGVPVDQVMVASTGVIGVPMPADPILEAIPGLISELDRGKTVDAKVATAILTTDTVSKMASVRLVDGHDTQITIGGAAKGSGMIAPGMATTITVITTDAKLSPDALQTALSLATKASFNKISVDGSMSTNDTIILLASGLGGPVDPVPFTEGLTRVCADLAYQVIADGEGATQVITMRVTGALDDDQAEQAARFIGADLLVRTAFAGRDPNWGRLVAAAGASPIPLDPDGLSVRIGGHLLCAHSLPLPYDRAAVVAAMGEKDVEVIVDLGVGTGTNQVLVNDLTHDYISINADYTS